MDNFGTFIDDCLQRASYSSLELDLLEKLLQSLPENIRISFIQAVYLDNLNLSSFGKSQFSLPSVRKYVDFFLRKEAKNLAISNIKNFRQKLTDVDPDIKKLIEENLAINGEGEYLINELENYFYNKFSSPIKKLL